MLAGMFCSQLFDERRYTPLCLSLIPLGELNTQQDAWFAASDLAPQFYLANLWLDNVARAAQWFILIFLFRVYKLIFNRFVCSIKCEQLFNATFIASNSMKEKLASCF